MKRLFFMAFALVACGENTLPREELLNPETCQGCHPDHYREWSGSMHAYAAEDPVFIAMNARGQRETGGALGDFCVKCHAPMAVRDGLTTDGLNLAELPEQYKGITCYFCHNVTAVEGEHNNPLVLADDTTMRGPIPDAVENDAHQTSYSSLHDRNHIESSRLCGSCHDIVTPKDVHLERTFEEWKGTLFAHDNPQERQTCGNCHMKGRDGLAADFAGVPQRRVHSHMWPGVDVAITDFPEREAQRIAVRDELDTTLFPQLCVTPLPGGQIVNVTLENVAAGHSWPSGAAQDRRVFIEIVASLGGTVVFESGVVPDNTAVTSIVDPNLWRLGDTLFDESDAEVHMFWEAARIESELLPGPTARSPADPGFIDTHVSNQYMIGGLVDKITMRVRVRPIGLDVLSSLVDSGDLDASFLGEMPVFTLAATELEWTPELNKSCIPES